MIRNVIRKMPEEQYSAFREELQKSKAEKFCQLLECYRNEKLNDEEIQKITKTNSSSYYTLRSRLQDRLQEYLFRVTEDERAELLKTTATVPSLIHDKDRDTAIVLLQYLETQLKEHDMPAELVVVYTALKKLHINSPKYYEYQQRYNKNIAYMLAIDKSSELLCLFNNELSQFLLSRDKQKKNIMQLYLKELANHARLYDSHRMNVLNGFAAAAYGIFVDENMNIPGTDKTVEDILRDVNDVLESFPHDRNYRNCFSGMAFLRYEYYHRIGLHRNNVQDLEALMIDPIRLLRLGYTLPVAKFFLSTLERNMKGQGEGTIISYEPAPETDGELTTFSVNMYNAAIEYQQGKYRECCSYLNNIINALSFKKIVHSEIQVKLFLAIAYLLDRKPDLSESLLRSISRKMSSEGLDEKYVSAMHLIRFLKTGLSNGNGRLDKLRKQWESFESTNKGDLAILGFLRIPATQLEVLAK